MSDKKKTKAVSIFGNIKYQDKAGNPVINGYKKIEALEEAIKEAKEAGYTGLWFNARVSKFGENPGATQSNGLTADELAAIRANLNKDNG